MKTKIGTLKLENPTMLAAGVLGTTASSLRRVMQNGAGAVVTKSIGLYPREGHRGPVLVEIEGGYINAMGLPNPGLKFIEELETLRTFDDLKPIIVSIFGSDEREFIKLATSVCRLADAVELNLSCPHTKGYGLEIGSQPIVVETITKRIKETVELPVWVKLTPNVNDITSIGKAAERGGADAVVAINTVTGMAIDVQSGTPVLGNIFGGVSGHIIRPIAVRCIYQLYRELDIPIVGVGGVNDYRSALELIMAGAEAIQVGSIVAKNISIFKEVSDGITRYLSERNFNLRDIVGIAHRR
ncbi:MAG TPA: dihydroorotate dehydrogenase [Candidatus Acidoferrales bacterium]|nr:dihydroorotate dehydrogenase [Candidatus Acidoferrales bacterium]